MSGVNKFIGIGNLGADAELRHTQDGTPVLSFRIAITEKWKDRNGNAKEQTEWVSCVLWGNRGEALALYLQKGTRVYVEGSLRSSKYTDKEGVERYKVEVNVRELELLGGGARDQQQNGGQQRGGYQQQPQQRQQGGYAQDQQGGGYGQRRQQQGGGYGQRQQGQAPQNTRQQPQQQGRGFSPPPLDNGPNETFGDDDIPF